MSRTRLHDLQAAAAVTIGSVFLGAPAGLLWSAVSPRVMVNVTAQGPDIPNLESNKDFIGADGSYVVVMLLMGIVCGLLAWWLFRRSGPVAVIALVVGGTLAGLIAASVGVLPGHTSAISAVTQGTHFRGTTELYLGRLKGGHVPSLRATWAFLGWPAGACLAFLIGATVRPEGLD